MGCKDAVMQASTGAGAPAHSSLAAATAAEAEGKNGSDQGPKLYRPAFADDGIADDYVSRVLARPPDRAPFALKNVLSEMQWISSLVLTLTPLLWAYGAWTTPLRGATAVWAAVYYFLTELGITAGYHRLWAHRAYRATAPLQCVLALLGTGAVQGSIQWWARGHRAHHRYTDTDLDPYGAHHGLLWSHLGWMMIKPRRKPGVADISDLRSNRIVAAQHRLYVPLLLFMGFAFPTLVAGLGWGDWRGGFFYASVARLVCVHHSTFCVNSLAHWLGEASFDNKMTPRDHFITALVTVGEGYHNFHHQFPMDYRNATRWYQYDPTKWFIAAMSLVGLASHLHVFPDNEVRKGRLAMQLQKLHEESTDIAWPTSANHLPVISWADFQAEAKTRLLIVVSGFIHDVGSFLDQHPGGRHLLEGKIGKDATTAFQGGVYDHSNAAHNLLSMMRVGVLDGGYQLAKEHALLAPSLVDLKAGQAYEGQDSRGWDDLSAEREEEDEVDAMLGYQNASPARSSAGAVAKYNNIDTMRSAPPTRPLALMTVEHLMVHPAAQSYVTPGQAYRVVKDADLIVNRTARRQGGGGRVGKLLW